MLSLNPCITIQPYALVILTCPKRPSPYDSGRPITRLGGLTLHACRMLTPAQQPTRDRLLLFFPSFQSAKYAPYPTRVAQRRRNVYALPPTCTISLPYRSRTPFPLANTDAAITHCAMGSWLSMDGPRRLGGREETCLWFWLFFGMTLFLIQGLETGCCT